MKQRSRNDRLEQVRRQFDRWRKIRPRGTRIPEPEHALRRAHSIRTSSQGADHLATLYTQVNLASVLVETDPEEAYDLIRRALPGLTSAPINARIEAEHVRAAALRALKDPRCKNAYDSVLALAAAELGDHPQNSIALQVKRDATQERRDCP